MKNEPKLNKFQAYEARQTEKGLSKVTVWAPDAEEIKKYAEKKRKAHAKKQA